MDKKAKFKFNLKVFGLTSLLIGYGWFLGYMTRLSQEILTTEKKIKKTREELDKEIESFYKEDLDFDEFDE